MHLALGELDAAMDGIEDLLPRQFYVIRGFLTADPMFKPLKGNPRFDKSVAGGIDQPKD